ncbi:MAG: DUF1592 domain-containing protein [Verrucomicrobiales bacterium]|nr:DUF1592 domain-containing protein [Verrucomicrobiales bacterium]
MITLTPHHLSVFAAALALPGLTVGAVEVLSPGLEFLFDKHCYECHDDLTAKASLDLLSLSTDLSDPGTFATWERIYDRIANGEMPPSDKPQLSPGEKRLFSEFLSPSLTEAHATSKGTVLRRLNNQEYENTINDLLGLRLSLAETLPEDGRAMGFDTVGDALGISMIQMQKYLEAATLALDTAIAKATTPPGTKTITATYAETRGAEKFLGDSWLLAPDGAVVFFRELGYPSGMLREAEAREPGYYRIRVTGYAFQSEEAVTFSVGGTSFARGSKKPRWGYFSLPPGDPSTVEFEVWAGERLMVEIRPKGIYDEANLIRKNGIENYPGPGLAISSVEITGPLPRESPHRGYQLIFDGLHRPEIEPANPAVKTKPWYVPRYEVVTESPTEEAIKVLTRFASAAFRRDVDEATIAPYLILLQGEMTKGFSFEDALRTALTAMLCSPDFLYLREPPGRLDDHALASRLSYFLSRSAPDETLRQAAREGHFSADPATLARETERLIEAPGFEKFIIDFTDGWLDLRDIDFTTPDDQLFPEFDTYLEDSMLAETRSFIRELILSNSNISHLVRSDFAMLNERLAEHYEIEGVNSPAITKVQLPPHSRRGGLLSQASILKVSANGTNTSPVLRGVWINERILGKHPAPPPPGIQGVEPDIRGAETIRELLDKHRDSESCQSCHELIDPPGFALESFNPIGGWRDTFRSLGSGEKPEKRLVGSKPVRYRIGPPVDASGRLQDGRPFSGFEEYRDLIAGDEDQLAKAFLTHLLTFSTGRKMGFSDRAEIEAMVQQSSERGHRIRDLIHATVASDIFRNK